MKKAISLILAVFMLLALSACSSGETDTETTEPSALAGDAVTPDNNKNAGADEQDDNSSTGNAGVYSFETEYDLEACGGGLIVVSKSDGRLFGVLDSKGNVVVELEWDAIRDSLLGDSKIQAVFNSKTSILDKNGNVIIGDKDWVFYANDSYYVCSAGDTVLEDTAARCGATEIFDGNGTLIGSFSVEEPMYITNVSAPTQKTFLFLVCIPVDGGVDIQYVLTDNLGNVIKTYEINDLAPDTAADIPAELLDEEIVANEKYFDASLTGISICDPAAGTSETICTSCDNYEICGDKIFVLNDGIWNMYTLDSTELAERYYNLGSAGDGWLLVENVDGDMALMSPKGNFLTEFGDITQNEYMGLYYSTAERSEDMLCIVTTTDGVNTVHVFTA